jgi:hypothetical protein
MLADVLSKKTLPSPAATNRLTIQLNWIGATIALARKHPPRDRRVREAISTLVEFFDSRSVQALAEAPTRPPKEARELLRAEQALRTDFERFLRRMTQHNWSLAMDATSLMPEHESWHSSAVVIAEAVREALSTKTTAKLGYSSDGPVAKLTAAIIPLVSGEHVSAAAVSKHLQRSVAKRVRK